MWERHWEELHQSGGGRVLLVAGGGFCRVELRSAKRERREA